MNGFRYRREEAARRVSERRKREDEAPRLIAQVPKLLTLQLEIQELRGSVPLDESRHVKHVVVQHAPALFELPCHDQACTDGGHDITSAILRSLSSGATRFEGKHECRGRTGSADCQRVLHYVALATYDN
jgi:hypothetical protein